MATKTKTRKAISRRPKSKMPLSPDEQKRVFASQVDAKRFDIWQQIFGLQWMGYGVAEIATATGQPHDVVDLVLHGKSLNRIRRIVIR